MLKRAIASAALALLGTTAYGTQLANGSFEAPLVPASPGFVTLAAGSSDLAPWTIVSGTVDVAINGNPFINGAAHDGAQYLDLHGSSAGTISQSFPTAAGTTYLLSFAYANNYVNTNNALATVSITDGANTLLTTPLSHTTSIPGNLNWTLFTQPFVATGTTATLTFAGDPNGPALGGLLLLTRRRR